MSLDALAAQLQSLQGEAASLAARYLQLDQERESLEARGQASQDIGEVRQIATQLEAMVQPFADIWNKAQDLQTRADDISDQITAAVDDIKVAIDDTNSDPYLYADTTSDACQETADDFNAWADEQEAAANA